MKANSSTARTITALMAATALCGLAAPALAQRGSGGGGGMGGGPGGQAMPTPTSPGTMDRMRDQDRLRDNTGDQDQDRDRDQDRLRDGTGDQDRLRDRDRIHVDQAVVGQMASWQLLSDQERMQFHARMRSANTAQ
ncbi:MAG: hypothetical protein AB7E24_10810, partial [Novosphingobium sp.]